MAVYQKKSIFKKRGKLSFLMCKTSQKIFSNFLQSKHFLHIPNMIHWEGHRYHTSNVSLSKCRTLSHEETADKLKSGLFYRITGSCSSKMSTP